MKVKTKKRDERGKKEGREKATWPTHKDVPHIEPPGKAVEQLEERDKELWDMNRIKKEENQFQQEATFLKRLMRRFKRL